MGKSVKYSPEVRGRAARLLKEHEHEYAVGRNRIDCGEDRLQGRRRCRRWFARPNLRWWWRQPASRLVCSSWSGRTRSCR